MDTLKNFLSGTIHTVSESSLVQDAVDKFNSDQATACLVEKEGEFIGIITREDIIQKIIGKRDPKTTPTVDVMSSPIYTVDISMSKAEACLKISDQRRQHLVVEENGSIKGIVSVRDLVPKELWSTSTTGAELFSKVGEYGEQLLKDEN
ncbi:MAG: CBS domain-containing protein [Nitrospinota bacterium]